MNRGIFHESPMTTYDMLFKHSIMTCVREYMLVKRMADKIREDIDNEVLNSLLNENHESTRE